jgi:glucose/arabinose dehydrogenase
MTSVKEGAFYGWPYSYYGQHVDTRVKPPQPELVAKAIIPDYALGATRRRWDWPSTTPT